ncbi:hypothetical protein CN977_28635 [Bacillus thuringiensis]|uniref:hypothetical protein n=1 Tax=Bacillus thuringiensis TaxID=1428 RepID=UPI000BFD99D0|nr:hypothetical protein [Bacillus thuringiensis]PGO35595.1 hypothetical protein CN977_28635 [Bacillus thuringiensis]PGX32101.1 hypothetical protein COE13_27890 [Bacillus thuringiensis]
MPEFEKLDPPASGGGGGKHKPKFDKKQKMLLLGGGIAVVLVALFMSKANHSGSSQEAVEEELKDYYTNYPTLGSQNSVVQDGMNTLVGRQEEIMNALLEATGKKAPSEYTQLRSGDYTDLNDAVKMQNFLIANGITSSMVDHFRDPNGYAGDREYYYVKGFSADKDLISQLSVKSKTEKLTGNVHTQQVQAKDAPNAGTNIIKTW